VGAATFHFNFTSIRLRETEKALPKLGLPDPIVASTQFEINFVVRPKLPSGCRPARESQKR
jgi:hypothetical protein